MVIIIFLQCENNEQIELSKTGNKCILVHVQHVRYIEYVIF